tara:strand:+ start:27 stop:467 length:441 start_codon:yes stop_codon:yes gene_type:complete
MGVLIPWLLLLLLFLLVYSAYILLFPLRTFEFINLYLQDSFKYYLPDIKQENGKKSFTISLIFSIPIWMLLGYFFYLILIPIIFNSWGFQSLFNQFIDAPFGISKMLIIGITLWFLTIPPFFICGVILFIVFALVHTFRKMPKIDL